MNVTEIKDMLKTPAYDFLKTNEHLGDKIVFLTLGGSHAYGTNVEGSDVDIRGCALNTKEEILTNKKFEQFVNEETDTTVYGFNKLISLLVNVNPNTIEMLGCKPEHYLYISPIGSELLDNKHIFLSKRCIYSFGGYANQQLRRLDNKAVRDVSQSQQEVHILNSIKNATHVYKERFFNHEEDDIKLYVGTSDREEYDTEIFMDVNLHHYPLRDWKGMWSDMNNIVKDYSKIGKRNAHAASHGKLAKHMMHLVRLYLMCFDILDDGEIITYREKDHDLLMSIRNGYYLDENDKPTKEFFDIVDELEAKLEEKKNSTDLPEQPDIKKIEKFVMNINERVVIGDISCKYSVNNLYLY